MQLIFPLKCSFLLTRPQYSPREYCSSLCPSKRGFSPSVIGQEYAASAAYFHQPEYSEQFSSPRYAASAAPGLLSLQRRKDDDALSHFTSVSQRGEREYRGRRRDRSHHHSKRRRPKGLLPWLLCLLFGRLNSWTEVKVELTCIANAVLVGLLLICIAHLFYTVAPAIWQFNA